MSSTNEVRAPTILINYTSDVSMQAIGATTMANNANSYISIIGNTDAMNELSLLVTKIHAAREKYDEQDNMTIIAPLWDIDEIPKDFDMLSYTEDTKWCYVEDASIDSINLVSAWEPPTGIFKRIAELITLKDKHAIIKVLYQDEGPNYYGSSIYYLSGKTIENEDWRNDIDEDDILCSADEVDDIQEEYGEDACIVTYEEIETEQMSFIEDEIKEIMKRR